nr:hypothetical protein [uncultured Acetatifactor sp.]
MMRNRNRRMAYVSLTLAVVLTAGNAFPVTAAENSSFRQFLSGKNGEEGPAEEKEYTTISLSTEADLLQLARDCELDSWSRDKYISLENDIVLQEYKGINIPSFGGIFEGGGYTISGLEIMAAGSSMGLFRYVQEGAVVRNLTVSGKVHPEGSRSRAGILAGVNYGRIINCSVSGSVTGAEEIGGIAGINEETGEIRLCQSAAVITGDHYTGGICGANKGILNNCTNTGNINTHSVEVSHSLENITAEGLEDINSAENVAVHTDTGGIAGYSEGKIYYCSNSGTIGYQHVGYNTGGIVGRLHQGYLQNCTNTGHVLGRKDVGGIAGQMEPFLEIQYLNDKLSEIDREAGVFFDLLEASHEELSGYSAQASALAGSISSHMTNASEAAGNLTGTANDLWYIYNQELTGINDDLSRLNREWADQAEADGLHPTSKDHSVETDGLYPTSEDHSAGNAGGPGRPENGNGASGRTEGDDGASGDTGEDNGAMEGAGNNASDKDKTDQGDIKLPDIDIGGDGKFPSEGLPGDLIPDSPRVDVESYLAALRRFGEGTSTHLTNITSATNDRSGGINENLSRLNSELREAGNQLQQLADVLQQGTDRTSANVDALMNQAKVLRRSINELRDDLFRYEGITIEDASDEAAGGDLVNVGAPDGEEEEAYYDTTSFQQGKITLSVNRGTVEADANVGGIVGQIATEYDFDPEDDISVSGVESFNIEQTVKAVVRESRNLGSITGKKDCVGGIAGKADFGAVISCESYGPVCSTGGSYVGGIAGVSAYCIRSCYTMGNLSGKDYIGGIAGKGCDIFYSYAYPQVEYSGEYAGSIAGWLEEEGILCRNYYVKGRTPGVDSIGYENGATPLDYTEFCSREGVPEAFSRFTVRFMAEGKELASFQCAYGEAIDRTKLPEVPEKEGFYGSWPEFDFDCVIGNQILEARYEKWITSLASRETDENGRPLVLVQGEFLPEDELKLEVNQESGTELSIVRTDENGQESGRYEQPVIVRVLCEDTENAAVETETESGYSRTESTVLGSYLEFSMDRPGTFRVIMEEKDNHGKIIVVCAAGGAVVVLLLIGLLIKKRKRQPARQD